jgi:predicted HAD superfamily Cof-like phosphohydrolase
MSKIMPDGSVRYRSDGKIQKPDNWQPPNIEAILAAYDDV